MSHQVQRCGRCSRSIDLLKRQVLCVPCQEELLAADQARGPAPAPKFTTYVPDPRGLKSSDFAFGGIVDGPFFDEKWWG